MSEPFLGQITIFSFGFPPRGWAFCNGQILSISQNTALFSLLGTTYGGNGTSTFALPNLQGRAAVGSGVGQGLSSYVLGQTGGEENHTLIGAELPSHSHAPNYSNSATKSSPAGNYWAPDPNGNITFATSGGNAMSPAAIGVAGGGQPHTNLAPILALNFCIALTGIFPSRN
jgi:microcystin-dependent protein